MFKHGQADATPAILQHHRTNHQAAHRVRDDAHRLTTALNGLQPEREDLRKFFGSVEQRFTPIERAQHDVVAGAEVRPQRVIRRVDDAVGNNVFGRRDVELIHAAQ